MYVYIAKSMYFGMEVTRMQISTCKCERDDYGLDEIHYKTCIRCMRTIPEQIRKALEHTAYRTLLRIPLEEEE